MLRAGNAKRANGWVLRARGEHGCRAGALYKLHDRRELEGVANDPVVISNAVEAMGAVQKRRAASVAGISAAFRTELAMSTTFRCVEVVCCATRRGDACRRSLRRAALRCRDAMGLNYRNVRCGAVI